MPKKLTDCVADLKRQGKSDDSAWPICIDSTGEKPHHEASYPWGDCISDQKKAGHDQTSADKICGSIKAKYGNEAITDDVDNISLTANPRTQEALFYKQIIESKMLNSKCGCRNKKDKR